MFAARADGMPLVPRHIEALCKYIGKKVEPMLRSAVAGLAVSESVPGYEDVLNKISKAAFLEFRNKYKRVKVVTHLDWRGIYSPYEKVRVPHEAMARTYRKQTQNFWEFIDDPNFLA
jgi:hypothetical protein